MPTTYTHWLFGERCIPSLTEKHREIVRRYRNEFNFGVQGPDIFFFYKAITPNEVNRYGYNMHDASMSKLMEQFRSGLNNAKNRDGSLSYLLGFLCHFTLDSYCHSYVSAKEKKTGPTHAKIESQFDRYLMKKDGKDPVRFFPTSTLHPKKSVAMNIAELYPDQSLQTVDRSMKDTVLIMNILKDNNAFKRKLNEVVLKRFKMSYYADLMITEKDEDICKDSNLRLEKLMNKAVEHFPELYRNMMDYLEKNTKLPSYFNNTFNEKAKWEELPVLSYEDELNFEVKKQD